MSMVPIVDAEVFEIGDAEYNILLDACNTLNATSDIKFIVMTTLSEETDCFKRRTTIMATDGNRCRFKPISDESLKKLLTYDDIIPVIKHIERVEMLGFLE